MKMSARWLQSASPLASLMKRSVCEEPRWQVPNTHPCEIPLYQPEFVSILYSSIKSVSCLCGCLYCESRDPSSSFLRFPHLAVNQNITSIDAFVKLIHLNYTLKSLFIVCWVDASNRPVSHKWMFCTFFPYCVHGRSHDKNNIWFVAEHVQHQQTNCSTEVIQPSQLQSYSQAP